MITDYSKAGIISGTIRIEGGYSNDPADSGGETMFGVTEDVARAYGFVGEMRKLPRDLAREILGAGYWAPICGDALHKMSPRVAAEVFDTAVNMGPVRAAQFLQRALNVLQDRQELRADGKIGERTLNALKVYLVNRDEAVLIKALDGLQCTAYIELTERREKDRRYINGWIRTRIGNTGP